MDDSKEGDNGRKGLGGKVDRHDILAQKSCLRHESLGAGDLDLSDIDASDTKSTGQLLGDRNATATAEIEDGVARLQEGSEHR
jgi:hypothetical protein